MNNTPSTHRGRFNSILSLITGTGYAISPLIMGSSIELFPLNSAWILVSILGVVVFISMLFLNSKNYNIKKLKSQ